MVVPSRVLNSTRKCSGVRVWTAGKVLAPVGFVVVLFMSSQGFAACGAPTVPPTLTQGLAYFSAPAPGGVAIVVPTFEEARANLFAFLGPLTEIRNGQCPVFSFCTRFWDYADRPTLRVGVIFEFLTLVRSCPSGYKLIGSLCERIVPENHTIRLFTLTASSASVLAEITPSTPVPMRAEVKDCNGTPVGAAVRLELQAVQNSGGHLHGDDSSALRTGTLAPIDSAMVTDQGKVLAGTAPASGLSFTYNAPEVSGDYRIFASCTDRTCNQEGPDRVWVGVKGLVPIPSVPAGLPFATYELLESDGSPVGRTDWHPDNHYLTPEAIFKLWNLGFRYSMVEFPDNPLLHINDASLKRGGVFDLYRNWKPPHHEHQRGTVVDIRANLRHGAIPESAFERFEQIAENLGIDAKKHADLDPATGEEIVSTRHFHVRLLGRKE